MNTPTLSTSRTHIAPRRAIRTSTATVASTGILTSRLPRDGEDCWHWRFRRVGAVPDRARRHAGAIAIDRIVFGLALVSAFSVGLASVLTAVGLVLVFGRRKLAQWRSRPLGNAGFLRAVTTLAPVMSALTILCLGVVIAGRSTL